MTDKINSVARIATIYLVLLTRACNVRGEFGQAVPHGADLITSCLDLRINIRAHACCGPSGVAELEGWESESESWAGPSEGCLGETKLLFRL